MDYVPFIADKRTPLKSVQFHVRKPDLREGYAAYFIWYVFLSIFC